MNENNFRCHLALKTKITKKSAISRFVLKTENRKAIEICREFLTGLSPVLSFNLG